MQRRDKVENTNGKLKESMCILSSNKPHRRQRERPWLKIKRDYFPLYCFCLSSREHRQIRGAIRFLLLTHMRTNSFARTRKRACRLVLRPNAASASLKPTDEPSILLRPRSIFLSSQCWTGEGFLARTPTKRWWRSSEGWANGKAPSMRRSGEKDSRGTVATPSADLSAFLGTII